MHKLTYRKSVSKDLRKISKANLQQIIKEIQLLAHNPRPIGATKLKGTANVYRYRVGDYRIVYEIEDAVLTILIIRVAHRRDVYKNL